MQLGLMARASQPSAKDDGVSLLGYSLREVPSNVTSTMNWECIPTSLLPMGLVAQFVEHGCESVG